MENPPRIVVRPETSKDHAAVDRLLSMAFGQQAEAQLVAGLREVQGAASLVAEQSGSLVGHIMFSPVRLLKDSGAEHSVQVSGLAPMAVLPSHQRQGVGSTLIQEGLNHCRSRGDVACVLLGHPDYYPRFGFVPARSTFGIRSTYDVPDSAFMALELVDDALKGKRGTIHYHRCFDSL